MKTIYGLNKVGRYRKPVVALGVFDGVHRAHRKILKYAVRTAHRIKGVSTVITFYPHPQKKKSLYSLRHRLRLISELGIDICIVIKFDKAFSGMAANAFVENILFKKLRAAYVCVGENFRFGKNAEGDAALLGRLSEAYNFRLKIFGLIKINRHPVSSSHIRRLITKGYLYTAQNLLGRRVSVFGTVVKGISLATRLGFPTANIDPHHEVLSPSGVYAAHVFLDNAKFNGICYIAGKRVEAHIFNFKKNIYAKDLEIQFIKKIRAKKKFNSRRTLIKQVRKDISEAKEIFSRH